MADDDSNNDNEETRKAELKSKFFYRIETLGMIAEEGSLDGSDTETLKSSPMSQRDFYQHVSGPGEGRDLETTASPLLKQALMSPFPSHNSYGFDMEEPRIVSNESSKNALLDKLMIEFRHHVETLLRSVDKEKVDLAVGQTLVSRNQPIYLDSDSDRNDNVGEVNDPDGFLVFLSIRYKKEFQAEAREMMQDYLKQTNSYENQSDEKEAERSSPDGKNSEHLDERGLSQTDDENEDDGETSNGEQTKSKVKGSNKNSPDSVNSRSPRQNDGEINNEEGGDDNIDYEEYEEEVVNEDGSVAIVVKRRSKQGKESSNFRTEDRDHNFHESYGEGQNGQIETETQRRQRLRAEKLQKLNGRYGSHSPEEYGRHESCFEEFEGYDDDYDGPKGILTSKLPDGTSTLDYDPFFVPNDDPLIQIRRIGDVTYRSRDPLAGFNLSSRYSRTLPECSTPFRSIHANGNRLLTSRAPQVPNRIRRLRSRHVEFDRNAWFVGSTHKSFNSRCSARFDVSELEPNSRQYYYFRSLPKLAHQESSEGSFNSNSESPRRRRRPEISLEELLL